MMTSTFPMSSKWLENKLAASSRIESHFVSVKEEVGFLDESSCTQRTVTQIKSNECYTEQRSQDINPSMPLPGNQTTIATQLVDNEIHQALETENVFTDRISPRCQVDVIDMESERTCDYKFILVYEDQSSKFVILRPLKTKSGKDVAQELFDIFAIIGAPTVLQSGNGREFASEIVRELRSLWTELLIVHGSVAIPSIGMERDFSKLLKIWLMENPGKIWWEGLRFIQMHENTTFRNHSTKTPHQLVFTNNNSREPDTSFVMGETMKTIWSEEDWENIKQSNYQKEIEQINKGTEKSSGNNCINTETNNDEDFPAKQDSYLHETESEKQTRSSINCDNSSGFKFVNVKDESPLNASQMDDSQSETEVGITSQAKVRQRDKYQLQCKICQKRYMKLGHLKNHMKVHTKANGFECTVCSKKFRLLAVYEKHMRRFHNSEKVSPVKGGLESDSEKNLKSKTFVEVEHKTHQQTGEEIALHQTKEVNKSGRRSSRPNVKKLSKENRSTRLNGTPLLECSYCQQKFDFPSVLKRHVRSHTNERPYVCQVCNKSFKQLGHLSQHSLTHTDYRSFQCATCGVKFESLDSLKIHSQSHRGDAVMYRPKEVYRLFECDNCKKVFTTKSVLERHIFTHTHERQFGCKVCGKRFKQAGHVKSHMLVHTGERKFECTVCSKRFSLSNSLKKHMYIHNGEKPYQCDVCGARFLEKRNLNGHLMTHTNERPFSCNICGKRYTLADTLRRHVSAAHEDGRTYQCEICAKMFKQLAHLYVHKKVHTDERPYQCHLCDKNFKHKNVLKSHLAIHANLRPFECDVCKATFVRKTNLQTHIASAHMNERPYVCTICNKRFKQVSHLNGHVVVHSNSMPYQCDFCDRRCNRLDNLKKHMRLHTKPKE